MRVSELMHTPAVTCRPGATIAEVAPLMRDRNVGLDDLVRHLGRDADAVADTVVLQATDLPGQP